MTFNDEIADRIYANILDRPGDDLLRSVLADRLEEIGRAELAEFVRLSVDLDSHPNRLPHDEFIAANERERNLFVTFGAEWFGGGVAIESTTSATPQLLVRRGLPAKWRGPVAVWYGEGCGRCNDGVWMMPNTVNGRIERGAGNRKVPCGHCHGTGTIPGVGPALVRRWPIERVVVTNREPNSNGGSGPYFWFDDRRDARVVVSGSPYIPAAVYDRMTWTFDLTAEPPQSSLATRDAAFAALSDAALRWAKETQP